MDGIDTRDSEETGVRYWVRQAIYAVLAAMAALAFVVSFVVEFASTTPGVHKTAHELLHLSQGARCGDRSRHAQPAQHSSTNS
jgi:hypothetical protein